MPAEQGDRIREAARLVRQAPDDGEPVASTQPDRQALEAMLSCGAFESAVLAIMGGESAFMLSRGGSGSCLASVVLPDGSEETIAEGSTLALALLAAHLSALHEDGEFRTEGPSVLPAASRFRIN